MGQTKKFAVTVTQLRVIGPSEFLVLYHDSRINSVGRGVESNLTLTFCQHVENSIRFRESLKSTRIRSQSCVSMNSALNKYRRVSLLSRKHFYQLFIDKNNGVAT